MTEHESGNQDEADEQLDPVSSLGDRFESKQDRREASETSDSGETGTAEHTRDTSDSGDAGNTKNTDDATRHRNSIRLYLPDALIEEVNQRYELLDGKSKVAGNGGIEKHKDFFEGLVRAGLENDNLEEYVGVSEDR